MKFLKELKRILITGESKDESNCDHKWSAWIFSHPCDYDYIRVYGYKRRYCLNCKKQEKSMDGFKFDYIENFFFNGTFANTPFLRIIRILFYIPIGIPWFILGLFYIVFVGGPKELYNYIMNG